MLMNAKTKKWCKEKIDGQTPTPLLPAYECTFIKNGKPVGGVTTEGVVVTEQELRDERDPDSGTADSAA